VIAGETWYLPEWFSQEEAGYAVLVFHGLMNDVEPDVSIDLDEDKRAAVEAKVTAWARPRNLAIVGGPAT
jgi:hypothetical protein